MSWETLYPVKQPVERNDRHLRTGKNNWYRFEMVWSNRHADHPNIMLYNQVYWESWGFTLKPQDWTFANGEFTASIKGRQSTNHQLGFPKIMVVLHQTLISFDRVCPKKGTLVPQIYGKMGSIMPGNRGYSAQCPTKCILLWLLCCNCNRIAGIDGDRWCSPWSYFEPFHLWLWDHPPIRYDHMPRCGVSVDSQRWSQEHDASRKLMNWLVV